MAYEKISWVNRAVERPMTYRMTDNGDGTVTLARAPGNVLVPGTPVNADNLNHMEAGIMAAEAAGEAAAARLERFSDGNRLHNSDFTQWVAQAGICADHGGETIYAGDRWELVSGTVTAAANDSGCGWGVVTLQGVIRQRVETPPARGCAVVATISGSAEIVYDAASGIVEITSAGAVLRWAGLYPGEEEPPVWMARGYENELLCCRRFFRTTGGGGVTGFLTAKVGYFSLPVEVGMRVTPTVVMRAAGSIRCAGKSITPTAITASGQAAGVIFLNVSYAEQTGVGNEAAVMTSTADLLLCADLG